MIEFGTTLRRIREDCSLSLKKVLDEKVFAKKSIRRKSIRQKGIGRKGYFVIL